MQKERITCHRTYIAGQGYPDALLGNSSPHEWDAWNRWDQPDMTKLNTNTAAQEQAGSVASRTDNHRSLGECKFLVNSATCLAAGVGFGLSVKVRLRLDWHWGQGSLLGSLGNRTR